jgi:hypothetical protein
MCHKEPPVNSSAPKPKPAKPANSASKAVQDGDVIEFRFNV